MRVIAAATWKRRPLNGHDYKRTSVSENPVPFPPGDQLMSTRTLTGTHIRRHAKRSINKGPAVVAPAPRNHAAAWAAAMCSPPPRGRRELWAGRNLNPMRNVVREACSILEYPQTVQPVPPAVLS